MFGNLMQVARNKAEEVKQTLIEGSHNLLTSLTHSRKTTLEDLESQWLPRINSLSTGNETVHVLREWLEQLHADRKALQSLRDSINEYDSAGSGLESSLISSESILGSVIMYSLSGKKFASPRDSTSSTSSSGVLSSNSKMSSSSSLFTLANVFVQEEDLKVILLEYLKRENLMDVSRMSQEVTDDTLLQMACSASVEPDSNSKSTSTMASLILSLSFTESMLFSTILDNFILHFATLPTTERSFLATNEDNTTIARPGTLKHSTSKPPGKSSPAPTPVSGRYRLEQTSALLIDSQLTTTATSGDTVAEPTPSTVPSTATAPSINAQSASDQHTTPELPTAVGSMCTVVEETIVCPSHLLDDLMQHLLIPLSGEERKNIGMLLLALPGPNRPADAEDSDTESSYLAFVSLIDKLKRDWRIEYLQREVMRCQSMVLYLRKQRSELSVGKLQSSESNAGEATTVVKEPPDLMVYHSVSTTTQRKQMNLLKRELKLVSYLLLCSTAVDVLMEHARRKRQGALKECEKLVRDAWEQLETNTVCRQTEEELEAMSHTRNKELKELEEEMAIANEKKSKLNASLDELRKEIDRLKEELGRAEACVAVVTQELMETAETSSRISDLMNTVESEYSAKRKQLKQKDLRRSALCNDFKSLERVVHKLQETPTSAEATMLTDERYVTTTPPPLVWLTSVRQEMNEACSQRCTYMTELANRLEKEYQNTQDRLNDISAQMTKAEAQLLVIQSEDTKTMLNGRLATLTEEHETCTEVLLNVRSTFGKLMRQSDDLLKDMLLTDSPETCEQLKGKCKQLKMLCLRYLTEKSAR